MSYVRGLGGTYAQGVTPPVAGVEYDAAETNYLIALNSLSGSTGQILTSNRARLATWVDQARATGVHEAKIIVEVLTPWNAWDEAMTTLQGAIDREVYRVQHGGLIANWQSYTNGVPMSALTAFSPTPPPPLKDIQQMIREQGGAVTGTAQYSGPVSPITPTVPVNIPSSVASSPNVVQAVSQLPANQPPPLMQQVVTPAGASAPAMIPEGSGDQTPLNVGASASASSTDIPWGLIGAAVLAFVLLRRRRG